MSAMQVRSRAVPVRSRLFVQLLAGLAWLLCAGPFLSEATWGQDWNAAGGGDWNTASNWAFPVLVPNGPAETAEFGGALPSAPSSTINISSPISLGNIIMNNPNAITFTGSQITWNVPSPGYSILQSVGTITLAAPSQLATHVNFGGTGGTLEIQGAISQQPSFQFGIAKSGPSTLSFTGSAANTFTGVSTVNDGILYLQKSPSVVAIPGDLTVNGGLTYWHSSEQVANTSTVTLNGGTLNFNSQAETIGRLNYYGGSIPNPSFGLGLGLAGTADALVLRNTLLGIPVALTAGSPSNVVFDATNNGTAYISGALDLGNATRTFNVANGTAAVDMESRGNLTGAGGLTKSGPGTLLLSQASYFNDYYHFPPSGPPVHVLGSGGQSASYAGTTTVTDGLLLLGATHTLRLSEFSATVSGTTAVPGPLLISGGTAQYLENEQLGTSLITVAGGTLDLNTHFDNVGPVLLQSGNITGTSGALYATGYELQSGNVTVRLGSSANLDKTTAGSVNLGGSSSNTYTGTTTVTAGSLNLQKSPGTVSIPGNLTVNGGTVHWDSSEQVANNSTVTLNGGTLDFNSQAETIGRLNYYGGSIPNPSYGLGLVLSGTGDALVMRDTTLSIPVALTGAGGSVVFDATNNGTATISGNLNLGNNSRTFIVADGSAAIDMQVSGAMSGAGGIAKHGAGTLRISGANSYGGNTVVNGGTLMLGANHTLPDGTSVLMHGGTLDMSGYSDTVLDLQVDPGTHLIVPSGSTLTTTGINLLNGDVSLNGTLASSGMITVGGTLSGSGTINGNLVLNSGTILSPGNSPGTMSVVGNVTWGPSATFLFEINDATGTSGSDPGWDLLSVTGTLTITASAGNEFMLDVDSFTLANAPGDAANFNPATSYSWTFASAAGGIVGFNPLAFLLDLSGFSNPYTGTFSIAQLGNDLNLVYTAPAAVPEPGTLVIWSVLGLGSALAYRRRARRLATGAKHAS